MHIPKISGKENFFVEVLDPKHFSSYIAEEICTVVNVISESHSPVTISLSGGRTPLDVYRCLSSGAFKQQLPWDKIIFFLGDERWTSDSSMRNDVSVSDHLFKDIPKYNFITWEGEDIYQAKDQFVDSVKKYGVLSKGFDILLLGIGEDGHIASLFPGVDYDDEIACIINVEGQTSRVSIGPRLIKSSQRIIVLLRGENKQEIVRKIFFEQNSQISVPAEIIFECKGLVYFFIDFAAAKLLN